MIAKKFVLQQVCSQKQYSIVCLALRYVMCKLVDLCTAHSVPTYILHLIFTFLPAANSLIFETMIAFLNKFLIRCILELQPTVNKKN